MSGISRWIWPVGLGWVAGVAVAAMPAPSPNVTPASPLVTIPGSPAGQSADATSGAATQDQSKLPSLEDLKNIRDPFKEPIVQQRPERHRTELEKIPVTDFSMVGVLTGPRRTRAILRSKDGKTYVVWEGTRIGLRDGYVRKILEDRIIVNEFITDLLGEREVVTTEIKLANDGLLLSHGGGGSSSTQVETGVGDSVANAPKMGDWSKLLNGSGGPPATSSMPQGVPAQATMPVSATLPPSVNMPVPNSIQMPALNPNSGAPPGVAPGMPSH